LPASGGVVCVVGALPLLPREPRRRQGVSASKACCLSPCPARVICSPRSAAPTATASKRSTSQGGSRQRRHRKVSRACFFRASRAVAKAYPRPRRAICHRGPRESFRSPRSAAPTATASKRSTSQGGSRQRRHRKVSRACFFRASRAVAEAYPSPRRAICHRGPRESFRSPRSALPLRLRRCVQRPKVGRASVDIARWVARASLPASVGVVGALPLCHASRARRRGVFGIQGAPLSGRVGTEPFSASTWGASAWPTSLGRCSAGLAASVSRRIAVEASPVCDRCAALACSTTLAPVSHHTGSNSAPRRRTRPSSSSSRSACCSSGKGSALFSRRASVFQLPRRPMI
jgi:hypothetical protein